jgi:hypothetical protein
MCQYKVAGTDPRQVDKALIGWVRQACDGAGWRRRGFAGPASMAKRYNHGPD